VDLALGDFQRGEQGFTDHSLIAAVVGGRDEAIVTEEEVDLVPVDAIAVFGNKDLVELLGGGSAAESEGEPISGGDGGGDELGKIAGYALGKGFGIRESVEIH